VSIISEAVRHMLAAGMDAESVVAAVASMEAASRTIASSGAERTRRWREKKASQVTVCDGSDACDVTVTTSPETKTPAPPKTQPSPEVPPSPPMGAHAPMLPAKPAKREQGEFLPKGWKPEQADIDFAIAELGSIEAARRQFEKFQNFWFSKSGKDGRKRDWGRTWRNWVMSEADRGKRNGDHGGKRPGADTALAVAHELIGRRRDGDFGQAGLAAALDAKPDGKGFHRLPS